MPITLPEYAKGVDNPVQRAIIELFPESVDFLSVYPFVTAPGGVYRYMEEGALGSNVAFRAINGTVQEGSGLVLDRTEGCYPMAGNIDVDRALIRRHGSEHRAIKEKMLVKQTASLWAQSFIRGDNAINPLEMTGLRSRLRAVGGSVDGSNQDSRILANSTASGGGPLSLGQLDRAIDLVDGANAIIMPKALRARFAAAERNTSIGGFVTQDKNDMGRVVTRYNGIPIYVGYELSRLGEFLPFNEVPHGTGPAVTASIYILRFGDDGVCGLETAPMQVTDIGLMENGVTYRTNIEHDVGMAIFNPYSALRLSSITNADIVK
jgi:hypothetical protein